MDNKLRKAAEVAPTPRTVVEATPSPSKNGNVEYLKKYEQRANSLDDKRRASKTTALNTPQNRHKKTIDLSKPLFDDYGRESDIELDDKVRRNPPLHKVRSMSPLQDEDNKMRREISHGMYDNDDDNDDDDDDNDDGDDDDDRANTTRKSTGYQHGYKEDNDRYSDHNDDSSDEQNNNVKRPTLAGNDRQKPLAGNDRQKPLAGNDRQKPLAGNDRQKPLASNDRQKPLAGNDRQKPLAGNDRQKPLASNDRQKRSVSPESRDRQEDEDDDEEKDDYYVINDEEMLDQSSAELKATIEELEKHYDVIEHEGNEWKTRYETQTEMNQQLEKQILLLQEKVDEARRNLKEAGKSPRDNRAFDDMADASPQMVKALERDRNSLFSQLRDLEWRLDQESKAYHKANDERKQYVLEINATKGNIGELKFRQRQMMMTAQEGPPRITARSNPADSPKTFRDTEGNIPEDQRIIDPRYGPIRKTAGVKALPSLDYI